MGIPGIGTLASLFGQGYPAVFAAAGRAFLYPRGDGLPERLGACLLPSRENRNGLLNQLFVKAQKFKDLEHIRRELERFNEAINTQHVHKALGYKTPFQVRQGKQFHKLEKEFEAHPHPMPICAGKVSFIRQVRPSGRITLLGEKFPV